MNEKSRTDWIREEVNNGQYLKALLEASARLENLFFMKLLWEKGIRTNLMKNWTLAKYIDWVSQLGLLQKNKEKLLRDFNELRNYVVHHENVMNRLTHPGNTTILAHIILEVCSFIDSYQIVGMYDENLEKELNDSLKRENEKFKKFFPYKD